MTFNEFNRRLEKAHLSNEAMYLFSHMFEVQVEFSKAIDAIARLMEQLTDRMQSVMHINSDLVRQIQELQRRGIVDGVEVHSVRREPDDE